MAKKVDVESARAFINGRVGTFGGNTEVRMDPAAATYIQLLLHGNMIAGMVTRRDGTPILASLKITHAGWPTVTTKARLNALPGVSINQRKGEWYLNGEKWDGEWTAPGDVFKIIEDPRQWRVQFPRSAGRGDVSFGSLEAAQAFVAVEEAIWNGQVAA